MGQGGKKVGVVEGLISWHPPVVHNNKEGDFPINHSKKRIHKRKKKKGEVLLMTKKKKKKKKKKKRWGDSPNGHNR